jgi:hypothetical protein
MNADKELNAKARRRKGAKKRPLRNPGKQENNLRVQNSNYAFRF